MRLDDETFFAALRKQYEPPTETEEPDEAGIALKRLDLHAISAFAKDFRPAQFAKWIAELDAGQEAELLDLLHQQALGAAKITRLIAAKHGLTLRRSPAEAEISERLVDELHRTAEKAAVRELRGGLPTAAEVRALSIGNPLRVEIEAKGLVYREHPDENPQFKRYHKLALEAGLL